MTREECLENVRRVQNGDVSAFEPLVTEYQKQVYNLALKMLGNPEDALDMSQEAFIRAYSSIGGFRGDSKFSVWLYRLTSNICIDFLRRQKRRAAQSLSVEDETGQVTELEIPDERFSPETQLARSELRRELLRALLALPEGYRRILVLREIDGLTYEEIGSVLSLEPGTVKSRIFRARKRICSILLSGNIPPGAASDIAETYSGSGEGESR